MEHSVCWQQVSITHSKYQYKYAAFILKKKRFQKCLNDTKS